MTVPPIVGVPFFDRWLSGPSSRISWPKPLRRNRWTATGVARIEMISPNAAAIRIDLTRLPRRRGGRPRAPRARRTGWPSPARRPRAPAPPSAVPGRPPGPARAPRPPGGGGAPPQRLVLVGGVGADVGHRAEDGDPPPRRQPRQCGQRGTHGL